MGGYDIGTDCAFGLQNEGGGDALGNGDVKSVSAKGTFASSYVLAGVQPPNLTIDPAPAQDQPITQGLIGKVKFGSIDFDAGPDKFGLYAYDPISPYKLGKELITERDNFQIVGG